MIEVEFSLAVAVYLVLTIVFILALWMLSERRKRPGLFLSEEAFFWQCNICTHVYVDSKHSAISKCPRCGSYNKKEETV